MKRLRHSRPCTLTVASPMHGKLLSTGRGGTSKQHRLVCPSPLRNRIINSLIVQIGVVVMTGPRVHAIEKQDVFPGYPFAKVRLKAVHSNVEQTEEMLLVPVESVRIRE